jgi:diguanylate cyclase (GGDEF)-like protein
VARSGGEEFVVLLPGTSLDGAVAAARRLCLTMADRAVQVDGLPIRCTLSAGVAAMDGDVDSLAMLMQRADLALYQAKALGRNRVECWQPGLQHAAHAAQAALLADGPCKPRRRSRWPTRP